MADHRLRQAYTQALTHLRAADGHLSGLIKRFGVTQPVRIRPSTTSSLAQVLTFVAGIRWKIVRLVELTDGRTPPPAVVRAMRSARGEIDHAWKRLRSATQQGSADPDEHAVDDHCRICEIRPTAPKTGGRCNTCHVWRRRNKFERPKKLDGVDEARQAQSRRHARGEGYGDESFAGARPQSAS